MKNGTRIFIELFYLPRIEGKLISDKRGRKLSGFRQCKSEIKSENISPVAGTGYVMAGERKLAISTARTTFPSSVAVYHVPTIFPVFNRVGENMLFFGAMYSCFVERDLYCAL